MASLGVRKGALLVLVADQLRKKGKIKKRKKKYGFMVAVLVYRVACGRVDREISFFCVIWIMSSKFISRFICRAGLLNSEDSLHN
jgi:predicted membrane protein